MRTIRQVSHDIDMIGHVGRHHGATLRITALRHKDVCAGKCPRCQTAPAHGGFVPDAHVQDIESTQLFLMSPVQGTVISKAGIIATDFNGIEVAQIPGSEQVLDSAVDPKGQGDGTICATRLGCA